MTGNNLITHVSNRTSNEPVHVNGSDRSTVWNLGDANLKLLVLKSNIRGAFNKFKELPRVRRLIDSID